MTLMNCKKLRAAVVMALALFMLGVLLQIPRVALPEDMVVLATLFSGVGLLAMIISPLLMTFVALLSLFPNISRKLSLCEH